MSDLLFDVFDELVQKGYDENINNIDFCLPVENEPKQSGYTRGSYKCAHKVVKTECAICNKNCKHGIAKRRCGRCNGYRACKHNVRKYRCKICKGSGICPHDKQKRNCFDCYEGDDFYCKSGDCRNRSTKKWNGYCAGCYPKFN